MLPAVKDDEFKLNLSSPIINDDDFGLNSELTRIWSRLHDTKHDIMQRLISSGQKLRENFTIKLNIPNFALPEDAQRWASKRLYEIDTNLYHLVMDMLENTGLRIGHKVECGALSKPLYVDSPVYDFCIFDIVFEYSLDCNTKEFTERVLTKHYENISTSLYDLGRKGQGGPTGLCVLFLSFYIGALVFVSIFASSSVQELSFASIPVVSCLWFAALKLALGAKDTAIKKLIKGLRGFQSTIGGDRLVLTKVLKRDDYPIDGYIIVNDAIFKDGQLIAAPILKMCSWDLNGQTCDMQHNINLKNIGFVPKSLSYTPHESGMNVPASLRENAVHEDGKINKFPFAIKMLARRRHI